MLVCHSGPNTAAVGGVALCRAFHGKTCKLLLGLLAELSWPAMTHGRSLKLTPADTSCLAARHCRLGALWAMRPRRPLGRSFLLEQGCRDK